MTVSLQSVRVPTSPDEEDMLVFDVGQRLVAVLTRLSDQHDSMAGRWFLEAGFGQIDGPDHLTFADLDAAQEWIEQRLRGDRRPI